jgi:hypothetical protein
MGRPSPSVAAASNPPTQRRRGWLACSSPGTGAARRQLKVIYGLRFYTFAESVRIEPPRHPASWQLTVCLLDSCCWPRNPSKRAISKASGTGWEDWGKVGSPASPEHQVPQGGRSTRTCSVLVATCMLAEARRLELVLRRAAISISTRGPDRGAGTTLGCPHCCCKAVSWGLRHLRPSAYGKLHCRRHISQSAREARWCVQSAWGYHDEAHPDTLGGAIGLLSYSLVTRR